MTQQSTALVEVKDALGRMGDQFKMALPPQMPVERFVRCVQTAVSTNTDLLECDRRSLYAAAMKCATDGLLPDGREAALVKFQGEVTYMPMVGGILKKVRNSGELETINAAVVCENDDYDHWTDEKGEHFEHRKARGERGDPWITYAYAITKDGGFYFEEIDEAQMRAIEASSRAKNGPWKGPFRDEMKRKSAIRRLSKRLPMSTDLDDLIRADDDLYDLDQSSATAETKDVSPPQSEQQPKPQGKRRPKALAAVAEAAGTPPPQQKPKQEDREPIESTATREPEQQQQQQQGAHPTDVI